MHELDSTDERIIEILKRNARSSLRDMADEDGVNLSASSIRNRMLKLEQDGVIKNYTVDVDYRKMGFVIQVIVLIRAKPKKIDMVVKELKEHRNVHNTYRTTGSVNVVCLVRAKNMESLTDFLENGLEKFDGIEKFESLLILE